MNIMNVKMKLGFGLVETIQFDASKPVGNGAASVMRVARRLRHFRGSIPEYTLEQPVSAF